MAIKYAILGLVSWRPCSGYDIKKVFAESTALYWSGNSNQVYPTLLQLQKAGLVTSEVQQQTGYPAKKVYSITESGKAELKQWVLAPPGLPEVRDTFLTRLAWADQLHDDELAAMLDGYEEALKMKVLMQREWIRRGPLAPARTGREVVLWDAIAAHDVALYESEIEWVRGVRGGLDRAKSGPAG